MPIDLDKVLQDYNFKPKHLCDAHYLKLDLDNGGSGFHNMIQELVKVGNGSLGVTEVQNCEPWFSMLYPGHVFFVEAIQRSRTHIEVIVHYGYEGGTKKRSQFYNPDEVSFRGGRWVGHYNKVYWLSTPMAATPPHEWLGLAAPGLNTLEVWRDSLGAMITLRRNWRVGEESHFEQQHFPEQRGLPHDTLPQIKDHVFVGNFAYLQHYHVVNFEHAAYRAMIVSMLRKHEEK